MANLEMYYLEINIKNIWVKVSFQNLAQCETQFTAVLKQGVCDSLILRKNNNTTPLKFWTSYHRSER